MPAALPLPIRILVKGSSTVTWVSWMGGPRTDFAFPRALEATLLASGRPAEVRSTAVLGQPTTTFYGTFEQDVAQWSPDVIVMVAGHYETIHLFLPQWFERHANRPNYRPGRFRTFYRTRIVRSVWKVLATVQAKVDSRVGRRAGRRRARRAGVALEGYVRLAQQVGSPLMIVLELLPPAERQQGWFPGMAERIAMVNAEHAAVVERLGLPNLRVLPVREIAEKRYGPDQTAATPDGFHYTPELHGDVAAALAGVITEWAATQPHLKRA